MREVGREKKNNLEEVEQFLKDQVINNKQLEELLKRSERELAVVQEKQRKITEAVDVYDIEVKTIKEDF